MLALMNRNWCWVKGSFLFVTILVAAAVLIPTAAAADRSLLIDQTQVLLPRNSYAEIVASEQEQLLSQLQEQFAAATDGGEQDQLRVAIEQAATARDHAQAAIMLFDQGLELYLADQPRSALDKWEQALSELPTPEVLVNLAVVYFDEQRSEDCEAALREALQLSDELGLPDDPDLLRSVGEELLILGLHQASLDAAEWARQVRQEQQLPGDFQLEVDRGLALWNLERLDDALAAFAEADRLRAEQGLEESAIVAENRANVLDDAGRHAEALEGYHEVERICLEQDVHLIPMHYFNRGLAYMNMERYNDALSDFSRSEAAMIEQGMPVVPALKVSCGESCFRLGRYKEALAAFDEAQQLRAEQGQLADAKTEAKRGLCKLFLERFEDAVRDFDAAEQLYEEQGAAAGLLVVQNRGIANWNLEHYPAAIADFERARQLGLEQGLPVDPSIAFKLGVAYFNLDDHAEAIAPLQEALHLYEDAGQLAYAERAAYALGLVLDNVSRYADSLETFEFAQQLHIRQGLELDPNYDYCRAMVYADSGDLEQACEAMQLARQEYLELHLPVPRKVTDFLTEFCR